MQNIDHLHITNHMFISTVLRNFATCNHIPDNALGEMQMAGVLRELFHTLKWPSSLCDAYLLTVLNKRAIHLHLKPSDELSAFMMAETPIKFLHRYHISEDILVNNFDFTMLEDCTTIDEVENASLNCEHHEKWKRNADHSTYSTMVEGMRTTRKIAKNNMATAEPDELGPDIFLDGIKDASSDNESPARPPHITPGKQQSSKNMLDSLLEL